MESKSDIKTDDTHAEELAIVSFNGREYAFGGFSIDVDAGRMVAYVREVPEPYDIGKSITIGREHHRIARFELRTWDGQKLAPLARTGISRGWYNTRLEHFYTLAPIAGYYWYGKGLGAGMFLRLKKGRKA